MRRCRAPARRALEAGLTLMEVILSLAILASVTVGLNQLAERFAADTRDTVAAGQVRTFGEAARSYIRDNYAAVQAVATATRPAMIDVPTLVAAGKLRAGHQVHNAFGQSTCALVFKPAADRLQAMVVAEGGNAIGDASLAAIAGIVGGSGGAVYATKPAQILGAAGGWVVDVNGFDDKANQLGRRCDGSPGNVRLTAGHPAMALWFDDGDIASGFLARNAVPGRPELNAMNTPLVMNSAQAVNAPCATPGAIAQDGSGAILACQGGSWKPVGDSRCALTAADMDTLQTDGRCFNGVGLPHSPAGGEWVFVEVFRHLNLTNFHIVQRVLGITGAARGKMWMRSQAAFAPGGGWSAWTQVADPDVAMADGSISLSNSVIAKGEVVASQDVVAGQAVRGTLLYSSGSIQADQDIVSLRNATNLNGTTTNAGDGWGFVGLGSGLAENSQPATPRGSAYVNDVYLRSISKWASQLAVSGMSRTQLNGVSLRSNTDYSWLTVTLTARYHPSDGHRTPFSDWLVLVNEVPIAAISDSYGVEQKQFNVSVPRGALVRVVQTGNFLLIEADVRVDLTL